MNAPWKSGLAGGRDTFAAFLCDEASLDVLRTAVAELGWAPGKCHKGGLRNAVQSLSITSSPNILMVDLSESGDPLNDIHSLAEVCEPGTVVLAIGQINDVRLYRDLVASGIHDYLLKPLSPTLVRDALMHAHNTFASPKQADGNTTKPHISTAVIGTRGGVGASTLATSLAWAFSSYHHKPTALLDLDIHFGTGALTLDLEPGRGLSDAVESPGRIDSLFIERAMIRANDNLAILSAEAPIGQPLITDGGAFLQLQAEFHNNFEMTVIDLPRNMVINFPHLLNSVNVVVVATELTLAGARDAIRIVSWLKANINHAHVMVVANKVHPANAEISRADFEASIENKVDFVVPFDLKAASHAAKLGQTFIEANRAGKPAAVIGKIAEAVCATGGVEPNAKANGDTKKSLLGSFDLKGLLSKKEPKKATASAGAR